MKKLIYTILAAAAVAFSATSCTEDGFLQEEMVSVITQQYYETESGLDALIVGLYDHACYICSAAGGYGAGPELWQQFQDTGINDQMLPSKWNKTGTSLITSGPFGYAYNAGYGMSWGIYADVNDALNAIYILENVELGGKYADQAYANKQKATAYFLKDWLLYNYISAMGDVYVPHERTMKDTGIYYAPRQSGEQTWKEFIEELEFAYQWLPKASEFSGSERNEWVTKGAAAFFLAHLYLDRAMGVKYKDLRNADGSLKHGPLDALGVLYKGGNYESDLRSAIEWANKVINDPDYALEDSFDPFGQKVDGDYSDEQSKEIVWSFAASPSTMGERGSNDYFGWRINHFYGRYTAAQWGLKNRVWEYGAHYGKTGTADWGMDVFTNKINDSRYAKSFFLELYTKVQDGTKDAFMPSDWYLDSQNYAADWRENFNDLKPGDAYKNQYVDWFNANKATWFGADSPYAKRVTAAVLGDSSVDWKTVSSKKINGGEISLVMIPNDRDHAIDADLCHSMPFIVAPRWSYYESADGSERRYYYSNFSYEKMTQTAKHGTGSGFTTAGRPWIKKYDDPNRLQIGGPYTGRNVTIYRLSDMYLLRAWAEGLLGQWDAAINDINIIRERAAWKAGEQRPMAIAQFSDYYSHNEGLKTSEKQYPYTVAVDNTDAMKVDASFWTPGNANFDGEKYPHFLAADLKDRNGNMVDKYNNNGGYTNATDFYFSQFMINEYSREFNGEPIMLNYQTHTGLKYSRIIWHTQRASVLTFDENGKRIWDENAYNYPSGTATTSANGEGQGGMEPYMIWQPITVSYMDKLTDAEGTPLTDEAKEAYQNPGY